MKINDDFIKKLAIILFAVSCILIGVRQYLTGGIAGGDSILYYSYLRSALIDHDLDFKNEYQYFNSQKSDFTGYSKLPNIPGKNTVTGKYPMKYPIGTIFSWLPFFLLAQTLGFVLYLLSANHSYLDGYSWQYFYLVSLSAPFYTFAGFYLIYKYLLDFLKRDRRMAFANCLIIGLTTPIAYYTIFVPTFSHAASMFWCTSFLIYFLRIWHHKNFSHSNLFILGLLYGFCLTTRYQDIVVIVFPVVYFLTSQGKPALTLKQYLILGLMFLAGFSLISVPQLLVNNYLHGGPFHTGYLSESFAHFLKPKIIYVLFSIDKGLFIWTPMTLIALIGLFFAKQKELKLSAAAFFIIELYTVSAWHYFSQGDSFSIRMLISTTIVFTLGLDALVERAKNYKNAYWTLSAVFIGINTLLMIAFAFRLIGPAYGYDWQPAVTDF